MKSSLARALRILAHLIGESADRLDPPSAGAWTLEPVQPNSATNGGTTYRLALLDRGRKS